MEGGEGCVERWGGVCGEVLDAPTNYTRCTGGLACIGHY